MKMFEYMAAGRAILTSDLPVIHEVLDDQTAYFCPPEDLNAWESALRYLKDHPEKSQALGIAAQKLAKDYTWKARAGKALEGFPG
jgi:glycosyltransferase involved in cell wall biosynthesis